MQYLALGTAQFGNAYGVTNAAGRLIDDQVRQILELARGAGITRLDTALGYGDAQERLSPWSAEFNIMTKIAGSRPREIERALTSCLEQLGTASVDGCLFHDWFSLTGEVRIMAAGELERLRDAGLVGHVGISAYGEDDLRTAQDTFTRLDVVQVPANVIDRRLDMSPALMALAASGTRVQVRSIFLQGLLLSPSTGPQGRHLSVKRFHSWCERNRRDPLHVAIGHARSLDWADEILVGVTTTQELEAILAAWDKPAQRGDEALAADDLTILDPRLWAKS